MRITKLLLEDPQGAFTQRAGIGMGGYLPEVKAEVIQQHRRVLRATRVGGFSSAGSSQLSNTNRRGSGPAQARRVASSCSGNGSAS